MPATFATPEIIEQISDEHQRWTELLRGLDGPTWDRSSACEGWTIKHVVAHVVSGIQFYRESLADALAGDPKPLWTNGRLGRQARMERYLPLSGPELIDAFDEEASLLDKILMKVGEDDAGLPAWHASGMWDIDRLVGARLNDSAVHRWDVLKALEPAPRFDLDRLPFLVDWVCASMPRYLNSKAGSGAALDARFDLAEPLRRSIVVSVREGIASAQAATSDSADLSCDIDPTAFVLLFLGRLQLDQALATGAIWNVRGKADALEDLVARVNKV